MSDTLIELGLYNDNDPNRPERDSQNSTSGVVSLADRLLHLISETAVESDTLNTALFRTRLKHYSDLLSAPSQPGANVTDLAADCLRLCQDYLFRTRKYFLEREGEFTDVIELMRMAIGKLAGSASAFNVQLMDSSERLNRLTDIEDIRDLKKRISQEVRELNRAVTEKQKQDELNYAKLTRRIETLQASLTQSKEESSIDPLTRVGNRGAFDRALKAWITSHLEEQKPFFMAMIDVDDFKKINDTHGHQIGDRVLLCIAEWIGKYVRTNDFVARYGGEEFVVMMADIELSQANERLAELLANMSRFRYTYTKEQDEYSVTFTASCGLAEFTLNESGEELLRRADEALYEAKRTGKNRVVLAKKQKSFWKALTSSRRRTNSQNTESV